MTHPTDLTTIAIIGAGRVGSALGQRLASVGHTILYGVRDPGADRRQDLAHAGASVTTVFEAAQAASIIILSTPWDAAQAALLAMGQLEDRILIDATNPIGAGFKLTHGHDDSGGEQVQRWAQGGRVVKAFHTTGVENMLDPSYGEQRAAMFVCGDDASARSQVVELVESLGFEGLDVGSLSMARCLEPMAMVWITMAMRLGYGRSFALGMLRRA